MEKEKDFKVQTEAFEGPLALLLSLIEKRKLLINDISLAKVTDDYIEYLKKFEKTPISQTSTFILIASTLLLIKSKSLLPTLELTAEESESIEELELRLKVYKRMKEVSVHVEERFGKNISFNKQYVPEKETGFAPTNQLSLQNFYASVKNLIKTLPKKEVIPKVVIDKVISLEDTIAKLTKRVRDGLQMSFREFAGVGKEEKVNIIVSFLAMLELVKQGTVNVKQHADYEDIHIETRDVGTPSYQ